MHHTRSLTRWIPHLRQSFIVVLFIAYLFMGLLVIEQGRVIDSQKHLIRDLFSDSVELTHMKNRQSRKIVAP